MVCTKDFSSIHTLSRNHLLAISPCFLIPNEDSLFRFNDNWLFIPNKWFLNRCICLSFNRLEEFYYLLMGIQYPPTPLLITEGVCAVKKYSTLNGSFLYHRHYIVGHSYPSNGSSRTSTICWSITGVSSSSHLPTPHGCLIYGATIAHH